MWDHFSVIPFHGGGDTNMGNRVSGMVDQRSINPFAFQYVPDRLHDVIGNDGEEEVSVRAVLFLVVHGANRVPISCSRRCRNIGKEGEDVEELLFR